MSKLSSTLKSLINAPYARPGTVPAPSHVLPVYQAIAKDAQYRGIGLEPWFTAAAAATMTMNSPESLHQLFEQVSGSKSHHERVRLAELVREIGLKCLGFNGIPRTINCLNEFHATLPQSIAQRLSTKPRRSLARQNIDMVSSRGQTLWKSVYYPFESKLYDKLSKAHPDLPVHIVESEYGNLFSDPPTHPGAMPVTVGRVLTSILGIACLRAQTGVGPQLLSHVYGLRKAFEDDNFQNELKDDIGGGRWLASDDGSVWLLESIDRIVETLGQGHGSNFAPGISSKL
ncbi:mitochondrial protein [Penicillium waksmanii]|uniref:mitochondrial protein n=1 Tax=Penicillium waksmanii TaxID=69791 RepID=UPI002546FB80|nr:mitochondrial protein [Penicillium waksmanii]KAJ5989628.1 mitochondrial protein [Penicillium waksmanii]